MAQWLPRLAPRLRESFIDIATLWRRDLFRAEEEKLTAILERDAQAKVALAGRLGAADLMEEATNGVAWVDQPGVDLIALMPTWVWRPWTLLHRTGSTAVISYPVADESLGQNGDALAARAVKLARVLSDESRVRAIQLLADRAAEPSGARRQAGPAQVDRAPPHRRAQGGRASQGADGHQDVFAAARGARPLRDFAVGARQTHARAIEEKEVSQMFYEQLVKDRQGELLADAEQGRLARRQSPKEPLLKVRLTIELQLGRRGRSAPSRSSCRRWRASGSARSQGRQRRRAGV